MSLRIKSPVVKMWQTCDAHNHPDVVMTVEKLRATEEGRRMIEEHRKTCKGCPYPEGHVLYFQIPLRKRRIIESMGGCVHPFKHYREEKDHDYFRLSLAELRVITKHVRHCKGCPNPQGHLVNLGVIESMRFGSKKVALPK